MTSYRQALSWLLRHTDKIPTIIEQTRAVVAAENEAVPKWEAVKPLGDTIAPIIDDFPDDEVSALDTAEIVAIEEQLFGATAWDGSRLKELLPTLIELLPLILRLIGR
jgi:hypothetical protein